MEIVDIYISRNSFNQYNVSASPAEMKDKLHFNSWYHLALFYDQNCSSDM